MSKRTSEAARARIAAQREALRKQERRKRMTMIITIAVIVVVAVGIGLWSMSQGASEQTKGASPVTIQSDGSVVLAKPGVTGPVVDVYEDYQCPACKQLEDTSGATLKNLAAEGKAKVVYHMITIFQEEPTKSNSLRAGSAARCVTDPSKYMAFHDLLYKGQPSESVSGFTNDELIKWGKQAGITSSDFENCVRQGHNMGTQQQYSTRILSSLKLEGTPTVMLNGKQMDTNTAFAPASLRAAVINAPKS